MSELRNLFFRGSPSGTDTSVAIFSVSPPGNMVKKNIVTYTCILYVYHQVQRNLKVSQKNKSLFLNQQKGENDYRNIS